MSHQGVFISRGTDNGSEISIGQVMVGRPIDSEIVDGKLVYTTTEGNVFPDTFRKPSSGGSVLKDVVDMEPLGSDGYLLLDRWGRVHAYGSATHQGDAKFEDSVMFGSRPLKMAVPLAIDLEVVPDPVNPSTNLGYYVMGSNGEIMSFGSVPAMPKVGFIDKDLGAVALQLDITGGVVTGYQALLHNGTIVYWNGTMHTLSAPVYFKPTDPLIVDFTKAGNAFFILDELGNVFGPADLVNDPKAFENLTGKLGFFDIEAGFLAGEAGAL